MYQSFPEMIASLVAEYLLFATLFWVSVATYRINEVSYSYFVAKHLCNATVERSTVAMEGCVVAYIRCDVACRECNVASIRCNVAMYCFNVATNLCNVAMKRCSVTMKRCNVACTSSDERSPWGIVATFPLVATGMALEARRKGVMESDVSVARLLAELEKKVALHRERQAFHAG